MIRKLKEKSWLLRDDREMGSLENLSHLHSLISGRPLGYPNLPVPHSPDGGIVQEVMEASKKRRELFLMFHDFNSCGLDWLRLAEPP